MMKNNRGMSLVEVLAALVILGIVFVGFMTIFPQMTLFNEKTESKLMTMNLAKTELASIQSSPSSLLNRTPELSINKDYNVYIYKKIVEGSIEEPKYEFEVKYTIEPELKWIGPVDTKPAGHEELNRIEIKVSKVSSDRVISETFGYLKK